MIEIPLTKGKVAVVDDEDAHLAQMSWQAWEGKSGVWYANRCMKTPEGRWSTAQLHRLVMGCKRGDPDVDHIDGDGLNCRRGNLRFATEHENCSNRGGPNKNSTTGFLGVTKVKKTGRFKACIVREGRVDSGLQPRRQAMAEKAGVLCP